LRFNNGKPTLPAKKRCPELKAKIHKTMQVQKEFKPKARRRRLPGQSQYFWKFKADQVLNKIFDHKQGKSGSKDGKEFTDVEILSFRAHETLEGTNNPQEKKTPGPTGKQLWRTLGFTSAAALSLVFTHLTSQQQRLLVQANNLHLLRQLQEDGPRASGARNQDNQTINDNQALKNSDPPSPPNEEWMEELAKLPSSNTGASDLLKVPLHGTLKSTQQSTPSAQPSTGTTGGHKNHLPQLLGIVQRAGTPGAAIIQWDGTSASVNVGGAIGTSGWVLRSSTANSAIIERNGIQRRLSIDTGG
jgi:hypothetical protein